MTALYSANYGAWDPPRSQAVPVQLFTEHDAPARHDGATT